MRAGSKGLWGGEGNGGGRRVEGRAICAYPNSGARLLSLLPAAFFSERWP
jgi:hypothetical protein